MGEDSAAATAKDTAQESTSPNPPNLSSLAKTSKKSGRKPPKARMNMTDTEPSAETPGAENPNPTTADVAASLGALAQVRELIVGEELGDFGTRIATLEETNRKQERLITQLLDAIAVLEANNDALAERCNNETQSRTALGTTLQDRMKKTESGLHSMEERLRSEIVAQGTVVTGLVQQRHEEMNESVKRGMDRIEKEKASCTALAEVLETAARSLKKVD